MLATLVVDWYGSKGSLLTSLASRLPGRLAKRAVGAYSAELPDKSVQALNRLGLLMKIRQAAYNSVRRPYRGFLRNDAAFARALVRLDLPDHDVFFGYSYASLEMLEAEKNRGKLTVLDQIDPGREEQLLVSQEARQWPQYAKHASTIPEANCDRNRREWELADVIVVNSAWSRQALVAQGVADSKIEIVPLAYEAQSTVDISTRASRSGPLRVLWLGSVCLRKGIQYLVEAARRLQHEPVEFIIAGPLEIPAAALNSAPPNMRWLGQIPRSQTRELFAAADVFVLPTISDGFAITQLEALAHGVPVIVTPNCGQVVEDGQTGFIIPPRDPVTLADAIRSFIKSRGLAAEMAPQCIASAKTFSVDSYARRLAEVIGQHSFQPETAAR